MAVREVSEIMEEIREGLTGEYSVDIVYLEAEADKYRSQKNGKEIESAISDLAYEILPADRREKLDKMMYIDGQRLDVYFAKAQKLASEKKTDESFQMTEALYTKIRINYRETEEEAYLSFRNTLEHQLYLYFYQPSKKLVRPVFDLSQMVLLHGYNLIELKRYEEAERVLGDAIRYNPMNADAYFEMAECYKAMKKPDLLLSITKETLEIAVSPVQISRCYCNLGYYAVEIEDYESAICFYYESLIYGDNPNVQGELFHIRKVTGKRIMPPSRQKINEAFEKYGMKSGANPEVVGVISALAQEAIQEDNLPMIRFYLYMQHGLTNDPEIQKMLDKYNARAKAESEKQQAATQKSEEKAEDPETKVEEENSDEKE